MANASLGGQSPVALSPAGREPQHGFLRGAKHHPDFAARVVIERWKAEIVPWYRRRPIDEGPRVNRFAAQGHE